MLLENNIFRAEPTDSVSYNIAINFWQCKLVNNQGKKYYLVVNIGKNAQKNDILVELFQYYIVLVYTQF